MTALLTWLLRKSLPLSMTSPPNVTVIRAGGVHKASQRARHRRDRSGVTVTDLEVAGEDAAADLRVVERQRLAGLDRKVLDGIQQGALEATTAVTGGERVDRRGEQTRVHEVFGHARRMRDSGGGVDDDWRRIAERGGRHR